MAFEIIEEPIATLPSHGAVSIAFSVERILEVTAPDGGLGGLHLTERPAATPCVKDYDAIHGEGPERWPEQFDVSRWGLLVARLHGARVGGAVVVWGTEGVEMLEGRSDLAVLWDIRVSPALRGRGIGGALFRAVEAWAAARGCRRLKIETQNINVPACRFYAAQGCSLGAIHRFAYPELPDEVQLFWYKDLAPG